MSSIERARWIRASQTIEETTDDSLSGVAKVDVPRCSSPRPNGSVAHFRTIKAIPLPELKVPLVSPRQRSSER